MEGYGVFGYVAYEHDRRRGPKMPIHSGTWFVPLRGIAALSTTAIRTANELGIRSGYDVSLFALMMFALGHGFATDLRFPWAARALRLGEGERTREQQLEDALVEHIQRVLAHFEEG